MAVIISDIIFILGILGFLNLAVIGPFGVIWLLAYILFIAETFISLSLESQEGTWSNLVITSIMYFTYSQLWIVLVVRAIYFLTKRLFLRNKEFRWYKTERSSR
ncbi:hypothetical protein SDC9_172721 [bioreactor metagenome]|uniref:Uncharacterized protein n=1 Tax=bioreactor metagenome TaxID=1076179 RepID=A0A645GNP3_9ZZZZ